MAKYIERRDRHVFRLVLDLNNTIDKPMIEAIEPLKKERKFATYLRNGLRLMLSLMDAEQALTSGSLPTFNALSLLELLFPQVCQYIATRAHNTELERLRRELAELRAEVALNGTAAPAPKVLRTSSDEPLPELEIKVDRSTDSGANFFNSIMGLG